MSCRALGYAIHPAIKRSLPANPRIAEPATGTADFLISIGKEFPGAQLQGFDITDVAFTPANERPANLTLSLADMRKPPPAEHVGKYDVVCMRYLNAAIEPGEDWKLASEHAFSLLKPGGALQWMDGDFSCAWPPLQSKVEDKVEVMEKCVLQALSSKRDFAWFTRNFRQILESVGFERIDQKVMSTDRAGNRPRMSMVIVGAIDSTLRFQAKAGKPGAWPETELDGLVREMKEEIDAGAYYRMDMHQFVAFKPE